MSDSQVVACVCGRRFQAGGHLAGQRIPCPGCGQPIDVPAAGLASFPGPGPDWTSANYGGPQTNMLPGYPMGPAKPSSAGKIPPGVWIALGAAGAGLALVVLIGGWMAWRRELGRRSLQELAEKSSAISEVQAEKSKSAAVPANPTPAASPSSRLYTAPLSGFSVEFPDTPRRKLVRSSTRGGSSHHEARVVIGDFGRFRGEEFLVSEHALGAKLTPDRIEASLMQLANTTANVDTGAGRLLSSTDLVDSTYRGREVTYEYTAKSTGNKVSGRYRVIITNQAILSLEWASAPAKAETDQVRRFFDSIRAPAAPSPQ